MSFDPDIDAAVRLWNAPATDEAPDPHAAVVTQLQGDAALVTKMRAEISRLEGTTGPRALLHPNRPDYVSQMHHKWLNEMLVALGS